jgi:hypothetical protein
MAIRVKILIFPFSERAGKEGKWNYSSLHSLINVSVEWWMQNGRKSDKTVLS